MLQTSQKLSAWILTKWSSVKDVLNPSYFYVFLSLFHAMFFGFKCKKSLDESLRKQSLVRDALKT